VSRWFRHYAGMVRDEKLVRAALAAKQPIERVIWVWGAILESAAEINNGGRYELDHAECAYFLRVDQGDIAAIENALSVLDRVREGSVGKWGTRQFHSDRSADRQQRYRERHGARGKSSGGDDSASPNVTVTAASRHGDAPETESDTEAKTEKKKEDIRAVAPATRPQADGDFEDFWKAYPKREGANPKAPARKLYLAAVKGGAQPAEMLAGLRRYCEKERKNIGTSYIKRAEGWLRNRYWEGEQSTGPPAINGTPAHLQPPPGMPSLDEALAVYGKPNAQTTGTEIRRDSGVGQSGAD
jgi:hypothetical protein